MGYEGPLRAYLDFAVEALHLLSETCQLDLKATKNRCCHQKLDKKWHVLDTLTRGHLNSNPDLRGLEVTS